MANFPTTDAALNDYFHIVVPYLTLAANATRLGVSAANVTLLTNIFALWNTNYPLATNPNTKTKTITQLKNQDKQQLLSALRTVYKDIPASALTDADRNTLNIPLPNTDHTTAPPPTSKPNGTVNGKNHLEHIITFRDSVTGKRGKPAGVKHAQVWAKIGDAPKDPSELSFLGNCSKQPFIKDFNGTDAGKTIYYWLRWEGSNNQTGPWGDPFSDTIPG